MPNSDRLDNGEINCEHLINLKKVFVFLRILVSIPHCLIFLNDLRIFNQSQWNYINYSLYPIWNANNGEIQLWSGSLNSTYYEGILTVYNNNPYYIMEPSGNGAQCVLST